MGLAILRVADCFSDARVKAILPPEHSIVGYGTGIAEDAKRLGYRHLLIRGPLLPDVTPPSVIRLLATMHWDDEAPAKVWLEGEWTRPDSLTPIGGPWRIGEWPSMEDYRAAMKALDSDVKMHIEIQGLHIDIENAKGSISEGRHDKWKSTMPTAYGYIRGTVDADRDGDVKMHREPLVIVNGTTLTVGQVTTMREALSVFWRHLNEGHLSPSDRLLAGAHSADVSAIRRLLEPEGDASCREAS